MKRVLKAFILTLIMVLTFSMTVFAGTDDNFGGEDGRSGNGSYADGASWKKTGYLIYVSDNTGSSVSPIIFITYDGSIPASRVGARINMTGLKTRFGERFTTFKTVPVEWRLPVFNSDASSNSEAIRSWLLSPYHDCDTGAGWVLKNYLNYTDEEVLEFLGGDYYLNIEGVLWCGVYSGSTYVTPKTVFVGTAKTWAEMTDKHTYMAKYTHENLPNSLHYVESWLGLSVPTDISGRHTSEEILGNVGYGIVSLRGIDALDVSTEYTHKVVKVYLEADGTVDHTTYSSCTNQPAISDEGEYSVIAWETSKNDCPTTSSTASWNEVRANRASSDPVQSGTEPERITLSNTAESTLYILYQKEESVVIPYTANDGLQAFELNYIYPDLSGKRLGDPSSILEIPALTLPADVDNDLGSAYPVEGDTRNTEWSSILRCALGIAGDITTRDFTVTTAYSPYASGNHWNVLRQIASGTHAGNYAVTASTYDSEANYNPAKPSQGYNLKRAIWGTQVLPNLVAYRNTMPASVMNDLGLVAVDTPTGSWLESTVSNREYTYEQTRGSALTYQLECDEQHEIAITEDCDCGLDSYLVEGVYVHNVDCDSYDWKDCDCEEEGHLANCAYHDGADCDGRCGYNIWHAGDCTRRPGQYGGGDTDSGVHCSGCSQFNESHGRNCPRQDHGTCDCEGFETDHDSDKHGDTCAIKTHKAHNLLGEAFDVALSNKFMTVNPCRLVHRSSSTSNDNKVQEGGVLTKEHIERLFVEALREDDDGNPVYRYGAGVALQLAIGCRSGELRALTWQDITDNVIHIKHSVAWVSDIDENGNLLHSSHVYISATKSDASVRNIPYEEGDIVDSCLKILRKRCASIRKREGLVMPTSTGWYLTPNNYNKDVKRIVNAVCDEIMASHALRHSFISFLVNDENCDIASVASLAGHGDIRVTLRYASHTDIEKKKSTLKSVSGLYNKKDENAS
ncbi:MAG: tyrosine-type recombinase/integrase [Lachnospiraceae bacterium]|nr:tyrosine-type recombinase/integrase [Lachnospiraceae bacterium]